MTCSLLSTTLFLLLCLFCTAEEEIICESNNISHGHIRTVYKNGERIHFSCEEGYKPADRDEATCTQNGWTARLECIAIVCPQPQILHGNFEPKQLQYEYQDSIQTVCENGYESSGISRCTAHGWQPPPACTTKQCGYIRIQNASLYQNQPASYFPKRLGYILYFRCNDGFMTKKKEVYVFWAWSQTVCTEHGWNPEPKCFKTCDPSEQIEHGGYIYSYGAKFIEGEEISFQCNTGYYSENQQTTVKCTRTGWSPPPRCILQLEAAGKCDRAPSIANGDIREIPKTEYNSGETVHYQCLAYHRMEGNPEVRCHNGHWTETPRCIVPCTANEEDMQRNNIRLRWSGKEKLYSESGDIAEFVCRWGYRPAPSSPAFRVQCRDGTFEYPQCI